MKSSISRAWLASAAAVILLVSSAAGAAGQRYDGMPYEDLVELYGEFLEWKDPAKANRTNPLRDVAGQTTDVYPDYSERAVKARRQKMADFQKRLKDMAVVDWELGQQAEYLAVRSRFDQHQFILDISRPWSASTSTRCCA